MRLDLRDIINIPGTGVTFDYEPDLSQAGYGSVKGVRNARAAGQIRNSAGVLLFTADVDAVLECTCARCLKDFDYPVHLAIETTLSEGEQDEDDPDKFFLEGDFIDVDEIISTDFVLNMDQRLLCRDDCKGLCEKCGADLNEGPCACKSETDPRLAVLGQFLENE
ncbi:uncharacterized protein SAMN02745823_01514 [Sporobacter termitidis DSM 10068]|uniref:ACR, COG1399 n=1 Tax=Sporobacter termitidis DSM 10068 TaxID=1123282 RepID=A0A1M5X0S8_9FIRM|nr:DUF177 domain-containing protein [Sporobacter termitidis]SHH93447.1 uncharacterized protein SAMN02745823_01514 [Sporobacter termitidis DSM 10068]